MRPLVLWDIDGTLIKGGGASSAAFVQTLRTVYALPEDPQRISYGGKTDGEIVVEVLGLHGIDEETAVARLPQFEQHYHALLEAATARLQRELVVLPGVHAALEAIQRRGGIQTLLTGNLEPTARIKLSVAELVPAFHWSIGAFGSDDRIRDRLVAVAQTKARAAGLLFDATIVIGDTPRDVQCARAGAARVVAVATGSFGFDELRACAPDALFHNLQDTDAVLRAVWGVYDQPTA